MKLSGNFDVNGLLAKEDERYQVIDNNFLKNLVLSSTRLNPGHSTSGHKHSGQEEIYIFIKGSGEMTLVHPNKEEDTFLVSKGDIVLITGAARKDNTGLLIWCLANIFLIGPFCCLILPFLITTKSVDKLPIKIQESDH